MSNSVTNIAGMLSAVTGTFAFSDVASVTVGTVPAKSQIISVYVDTTVAFNAGTTNTVTVGKSGSAAAFVAATSVASLGRASVATTGAYAAWPSVGSDDVDVTVTFSQTGTAASTGAARVTVVYKTFA